MALDLVSTEIMSESNYKYMYLHKALLMIACQLKIVAPGAIMINMEIALRLKAFSTNNVIYHERGPDRKLLH